MLNEIGRLFRRSIDAFREGLEAREPEDQVAELLSAMRRELVAARAALPGYEEEVARAKADLAREQSELAKCERRGAMAEKIGDAETVRIATEFAARHRERIVVLEQTRSATEAELALRRREAEEMVRRYKEADANRFALLAQLRSTRTRERMRSALADDEGAGGDWMRMEERVEHNAAYADALEELSEPAPPSSRSSEAELEERLRELKRRMGRE